MIGAIFGLIYIAAMLGIKDGKWGCFTLILLFFAIAFVIGQFD